MPDDVFSIPEIDPDETCNRDGAEKLRQLIEDYWVRRGFMVQCYLSEAPFHAAIRSHRYDVRSDMLNGFPVRRVDS